MTALVFCRAIALRPDLPDAYFNLGTALVLQGRCALAKSPLCSYMERAPCPPPGLSASVSCTC